jgi:hypothetical protein
LIAGSTARWWSVSPSYVPNTNITSSAGKLVTGVGGDSAGWGGLVKVASHWFSSRRYGTVMAVLSLSFLFGDAIGRIIM